MDNDFKFHVHFLVLIKPTNFEMQVSWFIKTDSYVFSVFSWLFRGQGSYSNVGIFNTSIFSTDLSEQ